ncbi:MAG: hypothetical protein FJ257_12335, partial [Phycisphaerae bacterium]|nr:hypothetical protein [Phycisphaerae bacterium]
MAPLALTESMLAQCGGTGTLDCCTAHAGGGCSDAECCVEVCKVDSFCCDVQWDGLCAQLAQDGCDRCGGSPLVVMALGTSGTLPGGVAIAANDLAAFDPVTGTWSLYFDGSDVGLSGTIGAATKLPNGDLLIATTSSSSTVAGLSGGPSGNSFNRNDLLRFVPVTLGEQTSGSWSFYFDGSDVGLSTADLAINGVSRLNDGSLVLATVNGGTLPGGVVSLGHDLIRFVPSSLGSVTSGAWSLYMKGANLGLTGTSHRLDGCFVRQDGSILLSTTGTTTFLGYQARTDIVSFEPTNLGTSTSGVLRYFLRAYEMGLSPSGNIRTPFLSSEPRLDGPRGAGGPPAACGVSGDCCAEQAGPGCADVDCCDLICGLDAYCCDVRWDEYCVLSAQVNCEPCVPGPKIIVSFAASTTLPGGVSVTPSDLAQHDVETGQWSLYFKGSNVGLTATIAAAAMLPDGDVLLSTIDSTTIAGLTGGPSGTSITRNDVVRFRPVNLGAATSGSWSFYFDGSDVGLSSSGTAIRALATLPDGRLVIGTNTGGTLTGVGSFTGSDLVVFAPTSLGSNTAGSYAPYFRGANVGLSTNGERLDYAFVNSDGMLLLSTRSSFSANGNVAGSNGDLLAFFPDAIGDATAGVLGIYTLGLETGLPANTDLRGGFVLYPVVPLMPRPDIGDGGGGGGGGGGDGGGGGGGDEGWTQVSPAIDPANPLDGASPLNSRLIYVDAVNGDDAAASAVNGGKGYYLPSHAAIGADPFNPVGPITAYKTVIAAMKKVRLSGCTGEDANGFPVYGQDWLLSVHLGHPDWLLFRRGRTYDVTLEHPWGTGDFGVYLGRQHHGWRNGGTVMFPAVGMLRGRSASEPAVVGAWGPPSDARPILTTTATPYALTINGGGKHLRYLSLDVSKSLAWSYWSGEYNYPDDSGDVLVEDVLARSFGGTGAARFVNGVTIRRSQCIDSFNPSGHNQGLFVSGESNKVVLEECIFDRNGYKENPNLPQTWTSRVVSSGSPGELAPGTGVQPTRTYFDRNLYASSYDSLVVRGCIFSREGGGGNVQMRAGGVAERNLFVFCAIAVGIGHPQASRTLFKSSLLRSNAVLHDDCFLPPGGWGAGLGLGGLENNVSVADDNVIAHFHRSSNGGGAIVAQGNGAYQAEPARKLGRAVVKDNAAYFSQPSNPYGLGVVSGLAEYGVLDADMTGNEVSAGLLNNAGDAPKPASWTFSGNRYQFNSTFPSPFRWGFYGEILQHGTAGDLAGWKAQGYDTDLGAVDTDFAAFKASVGWTAPERDIVSYMQSVDPTYVVNEDVYVDDGASGPKQATRQKVWQVMATGIPGGYSALPEAQAKLAARRYHAFITFIQRARENRKGAWDPRWTADAVNDYIRQGFGKPSVRPGLTN